MLQLGELIYKVRWHLVPAGFVFTLTRGHTSMVVSSSKRLISNLAVVCTDFTFILHSWFLVAEGPSWTQIENEQ